MFLTTTISILVYTSTYSQLQTRVNQVWTYVAGHRNLA